MKLKSVKKQSALTIIFLIFSWVMVNGVHEKNSHVEKEITEIDALKNYTTAYIKGEVTKILDEDEFRLTDSSGDIRVYTGWRNTNMVSEGSMVTVQGKLEIGWLKEFYAEKIIFSDGKVIELKTDD